MRPPKEEIVITAMDVLHRERWQAAVHLAPYLAKALWRIRFVESRDIPTMAISDRFVMYYNPDDVARCDKEGTLGEAIIHECLHPTLRHGARGKLIRATDPARLNRAGDKEIASRILAMSWNSSSRGGARAAKIPSTDLRPESGREHWCMEEHYKADDGKHECRCSGGSGATGQKADWETSEGIGCSEAEAEIVRAQVAEEIKQYSRAGRGSVPAGLLRWAEEYGEAPPIDWRSLVQPRMRYQLDAKRGSAASYARFSRRRMGDFLLPVRRTPVPKIVIVGDTSASMRDGDIATIIAVVYDAVQCLGRVFAIGCDAVATEPVEVRHVDDLREALRGGGGTSMPVGIEKALESDPDLILVVTDGETGWPSEEPGVPVTIVLTHNTDYETPEWAETIRTNS